MTPGHGQTWQTDNCKPTTPSPVTTSGRALKARPQVARPSK